MGLQKRMYILMVSTGLAGQGLEMFLYSSVGGRAARAFRPSLPGRAFACLLDEDSFPRC